MARKLRVEYSDARPDHFNLLGADQKNPPLREPLEVRRAMKLGVAVKRRVLPAEVIGPFGRQCLLARRLVERGVRFVQIYCGAENTTARKIRPNWDSYEDLVRHHGYSYDLHATALHLLGLDHEKLSFYNNGINRRLTDVHGHGIREILA